MYQDAMPPPPSPPHRLTHYADPNEPAKTKRNKMGVGPVLCKHHSWS